MEKYLSRICKAAESTFLLGWDSEFGGLFRFVDRDGGRPRGEGNEEEQPADSDRAEYEKMVLGTWDSKLWWPHAEALYLFALLYEKSRDYAFSVFPDRCLGEWVQIRRRDGMPEDRVVALPVKDPFHILRSFIKLVELAERTSGGTYFE